nr:retrotransposon protein, putative, Ty1-copia subclass [Tanacetum cinerariifolium]
MLGLTFGLLGLQSDYDGHGWLQTSGHYWTNQVQQRDYEVVMDHYIRMAIKNAPWPINETMVGKKLSEHIDEFNKLIGDLTNIDVDINDEDQALMLLTLLPRSYANFVETLLYGRDSLTLEDFLSSLNVRELKKRTDAKDDGDGLYVRGTSDHQGVQCGTVLLGDNKACDIIGIEKVRVQMKDGSSFVLENVRYIPNLNRNLISLGTLDREGYTVKLHNGKVKAEATMTAAYLINRSPYITLEKRTPMDLWSGHPTNYEMLRIFSCIAYSHVNQGKLKPRSIKCIFLGYPDGVKGYRLWRLDDVKPKIIISRDVVFNESLMYKDTLKGAGAADYRKEVKFEVELQGSRNLDNYVLVCDRAKRTTSIPIRYKDEGNVSLSRPSWSKVDGMVAYAFAIAEEEDTHEPITFQEVINSFDKDEWVRAMEEDMSSLMKNHTWELVDQPPGQKLVTCKRLYKIKEGIEGVQIPSRSSYNICVYFKEFAPKFDMKELGPAKKILGIEIIRDRGSRTLKVSQSGYVPLGAHFKVSLKDCPSNDWDVERMSKVPYANAVEYQGKNVDVDGYVDADYAKDLDKGRSITGYVFMVHGCVVSWKAILQHVVVLSTTEPDYMALTKAVKESIWLKGLLIELRVNLRSGVLNYDNQSVIQLSRNAIFLERMKHINVRYHFIKEIMESKEIKVEKIGTKDNAADAFTKVVLGLKFKYCMEILGVGIN